MDTACLYFFTVQKCFRRGAKNHEANCGIEEKAGIECVYRKLKRTIDRFGKVKMIWLILHRFIRLCQQKAKKMPEQFFPVPAGK